MIRFWLSLKHTVLQRLKIIKLQTHSVTNRLGVKVDKVAGRKKPTWKWRLQIKIKELGKDLNQLEVSKDKYISNFRHWEKLERKYSIRVKRLNVVIEELKQRITAIAAKVGRYQGRVDSYRKNRLFENNQRQFYRELDQEEERCDDDQPVVEESIIAIAAKVRRHQGHVNSYRQNRLFENNQR